MRIRVFMAIALAGLLSACSSSTPTTPSQIGTSGSSGTTVSIVSGASVMTVTAYAPNPVVVAPGSKVTWTNNDNVAHTSTGTNGGWDSGTIAPGQSFTTTLSTPGTYAYHCAIHPGMVGSVTVQ